MIKKKKVTKVRLASKKMSKSATAAFIQVHEVVVPLVPIVPSRPGLPPYAIYKDWQSRTCIEVLRTEKLVKFITMSLPEGLIVGSMTPILFDHRFTQVHNYPLEKACQIYADYGRMVGASSESILFLRKVITITNEQELEMKKQDEKSKVVAAVKQAQKPVAAKKPAEKKESAAQMFQDLIMQGKFTDDVIFSKVKEKFGLDDKKRGYVTWYRNFLKKQGKTVPLPKAK